MEYVFLGVVGVLVCLYATAPLVMLLSSLFYGDDERVMLRTTKEVRQMVTAKKGSLASRGSVKVSGPNTTSTSKSVPGGTSRFNKKKSSRPN